MSKIYTVKDAGEISRLKEELKIYKEVVKVLRESNSFYANERNWVDRDDYEVTHKSSCDDKIAIRDDKSLTPIASIRPYFGGKRARQAEKKVKELLSDNESSM